MSLNNNNDAVLVQASSDFIFTAMQALVQGVVGTVNTQNAATGGCAGNCVTWESGSKWSTDSSLVSTLVRINGVLYVVSSIQSQTVLTLMAAPETQHAVAY